MTATTEVTFGDAADFILSNSADKQIFVGPLVCRPSDGTASKVWYVMVCTADEEREFHCDQIFCHDDAGRAALIHALAKPGVIIHSMVDELDMARLCEALWPGEKISRLRRGLEMERAA